MKGLIFVAVLASATLDGQEFRGIISGSVVDPQNASIAKAKIEATETRTGATSTALSDAAGRYAIPFLSPGTYRITAEAPGFKRFVQERLVLETGAHPVLDIRLDVGEVSQSLAVTAEAPKIETANGSVSQPITMRQVEDSHCSAARPICSRISRSA